MKQFLTIQIDTGCYRITDSADRTMGFVTLGRLVELRDGRLTVRGRSWVVVGWEDQEFPKLGDAAHALFTRYRNLNDAREEILELRRLESFKPIFGRVSRRAPKKSSEKKINKAVSRSIRELRTDYRESLRRASLAVGSYSVSSVGG